MKTVIKSEALPGSLHAEPVGGRFGRWGPGARVRAVAVGAVLAVTAAAVAALGTAGPAAASSGTSYAYAWGKGGSGQLGNGSTADQFSPVDALSQVAQVSGGFRHTVAVRADGTVWAWGDNAKGELGNGTTAASLSPVQVLGLKGVVQVAAGFDSSLALRSDGTVWAWGYNTSGQLGDGTTIDRTKPVKVGGLTGVAKIAAGGEQSFALRSNGTVVAWGNNGYGQLGDGTTATRTTPVAVSGLTKVTQIAGGSNHSVALRSDGTVMAWGYNAAGEVGDGTLTNRTKPVKVPGLIGVTQIAAGTGDHSLAVRSDGSVMAWGYNAYGQLGDGTTTTRTKPVTVPGLTKVTRVSAGASHSVALRSDGSVVAWGYNHFGQLGDGTTTNRTKPVNGPGLMGVTQVAAGGLHTLVKVGPPELTAKATISGTGNVGGKLTCKAAFLTANLSVSYTWLRDAKAIPGATAATYVPVAGDAGHKATCQVTGTNGMGSTDTSATITIHAPAHFKAGTPPIAHLGKKYSFKFATTGSPTPKITRVSGTLPSGLKLATNGTLSGTPTHKGTYKFTLKATNLIGTAAKTNKSVTVK
jgi:alpha-tubulin suppressor-like RCC1 family protein